jgi:hypothetical protein
LYVGAVVETVGLCRRVDHIAELVALRRANGIGELLGTDGG